MGSQKVTLKKECYEVIKDCRGGPHEAMKRSRFQTGDITIISGVRIQNSGRNDYVVIPEFSLIPKEKVPYDLIQEVKEWLQSIDFYNQSKCSEE